MMVIMINTFVALGRSSSMRSLSPKRAPDRLRFPRLVIVRPLSYTIITVFLVVCGTTKSHTASTPLAASTSIRIFQLAANDVVYDQAGQMLYTSVPSGFGKTGNSIMPINPATLVPGAPIWMGSEPGRMAVSGDGKFLYAALNGAGAIRRFDLLSQSPDQRFALGNQVRIDPDGTTIIEGPYYARDLKVLPGRSDSVVAIRYFPCCSGSFGVAEYRDGVKLPADSGSVDPSTTFRLTVSENASVLYGIGLSGDLLKFTLDDNGVSLARVTRSFDLINGVNGADIAFAAGRIYTTNGLVIDPETPKIVGNFSFPHPTTVWGIVPDPATGRLYVLTSDQTCNTCPYSAVIYAFDLNTLSLIDSIEVTGLIGVPRSFIRWGANGFAFRTNQSNGVAKPTDQVFVIRTSLVPSAESTDLPAATQPERVLAPTLPSTIKEIALPNDDLIYDATRRLIYASVPGFAGALGNSIVPIDPNSGDLGSATTIGTNPGKLAISRDDHYLYAALITDVISDEKVRRLDLQSHNIDAEFGFRAPSSNPLLPPDLSPQFVTDMDVLPDDPTAVVFARAHSLSGFQPGGLALYQNGAVVVAKWFSDQTTVETTDDPLVFYGSNTQSAGGNGASQFLKWQIGLPGIFNDPYSPAYIAQGFVGGFACDVRWSGGFLFDCTGRVANPTSLLSIGTFDLFDSLSRNVVLPDTAAHKAYFLSGLTSSSGSTWTLRVYDTDTFLLLGLIQVPGVKGDAGSLIRWGSNGLAFGTGGNQVFLIQNSLINSPILPTPFIDNVAGEGVAGGTSNLRATLTSGGAPLIGKQIIFTVNGSPICGVTPACPTTNAFGIATLSNINLPGISAGTFAGAIQANFAGDANFAPASNTGTLAIAAVPQLFTDVTNHLLAIDSVTFVAGPFSVAGPNNFSTDHRTRVMIFTSSLGLTQPSPDLSVTLEGVPLTIEAVGPLPGVPDMSYIIVKLDPALTVGNLQMSITFHGATSNAGLISIGP